MEDEDFVFDDEACGDDPIVEAAFFEMVTARDDGPPDGG
ncbi:hypothetical protein ACVI1J_001691 [Bradyrhizobium diazoefficiens]